MKRLVVLLGLLLLFTGFSPAAAQAADQALVKGLRIWAAPDHTRMVFDTDGPVLHQIFPLHRPERLVIDIQSAHLGGRVPSVPPGARFIERIRSAARNGEDLRVVLDLKQPIRAKSFMLKPNQLYGHRLVVDLEEKAAGAGGVARPVVAVPQRADKSKPGRDVVVAVDAGHGGDDPGAVGPKGTYEKDVVLAIARRLAHRINRAEGMRAVLTRKGDYYVGLRKRVQEARAARADLFVSIHADSYPDDQAVQGSSVFTLSERGASNEAARWLAEKENSADLVGGVALDDKGELLATVLLDLSMSATMESGRQAAASVLRQLRRVGRIHKEGVQHAGFVVLKAPDIPGMLVETAYISNPVEEAELRNPKQQAVLAGALFRGIQHYFQTYPPAGTWLAQNTQRHHVVEWGDTLSTVAQQYSVRVSDLREANHLTDDQVRVGQVLTIPNG
jgi:N-acetylmuramoyl-L-alanine amidase